MPSSSRMPRGSRIDTLLLGCTHYPLLGAVIRGIVGEGIAVIDSASATASALASLLEIHGLAAPDGREAQHHMLTTGDVAAFRETAVRLFGAGPREPQPARPRDCHAASARGRRDRLEPPDMNRRA